MPVGHLCVFFRPVPPDTPLLAALGEVHGLFPHMPPCLASHFHTTLVCLFVGLAITLGIRTSANTPWPLSGSDVSGALGEEDDCPGAAADAIVPAGSLPGSR